MNKIISAFITFDCTCGHEQAMELGKSKHYEFKFLGSHPRFAEADCP
tara:strand:- start:2219 stop:2359 length:141 start_codon:yes stop_codon:yes gene_type:complete